MTQYVRELWRVQEGLPQNTINAMVQTRDGYLWMGTQSGLVRFDGLGFKVFDHANTPQLANNWVTALAEGTDGTLWIGTEGGGLVALKGDGFRAYGSEQGLPGQAVAALAAAPDGSLWVGLEAEGVAHFARGVFTRFGPAEGLPAYEVLALGMDAEGPLWVGTRRGLARWDGTRFQTVGGETEAVTAVARDRTGRLWVGRKSGLGYLDAEAGRVVPEGRAPIDGVTGLLEDRDGNLWVGTGRGLRRWTGSGLEALPSAQFGEWVRSLYEDREGSLWVGTEVGLVRLRNGRVAQLTAADGLSGELVWAVLQEPGGALWIGNGCCGLDRFEGDRVEHWDSRSGLPRDGVRSLFREPDGTVWVSFQVGGVARIKDGKVLSMPPGLKELQQDVIRAFARDREGAVWVGLDQGVGRIFEGELVRFDATRGFTDKKVFSLAVDSAGVLWVGTFGDGLLRVEQGQVTQRLTSKEGLGSDFVIALFEAPGKDLWVGAYGGGLNRIRGNQVRHFGSADGLFDDNVGSLLGDGRGSLWMSSGRGIFTVSLADVGRFERGEVERLFVRSYGAADGMATVECNGGSTSSVAARYDSSGRADRVYFPTTAGVSYLDLDEVLVNPVAPSLAFESVQVNGRPIDPAQVTEVAPRSSVRIGYAALSLVYPKGVRYRYRLEGLDDWSEVPYDQRTAAYGALPAGEYTFRVSACNNDGVWNEEGARWTFRVKPAFTETPWFYGLCAAGVALFGYSLSRARVVQLRRRQRELQEKVDEQTQEIRREQEKSERLLLNVLPRPIALELKETGKVLPVEHRDASVMFTDFKGFTQAAEKMSPLELVAELEHCFRQFDLLMERHHLEKMKTIGDSYMCAGGVPVPNRTHPVDCVLCAMEIQALMRRRRLEREAAGAPYWELRLGIHTGPAVAGVIGAQKFAYDLWGDTVNTASRMESSGEPNRINISSVTFERVRRFFLCEARGQISAKHKGVLEMHFVNGLRPELSVDGRGEEPNAEFWKLYEAVARGPVE